MTLSRNNAHFKEIHVEFQLLEFILEGGQISIGFPVGDCRLSNRFISKSCLLLRMHEQLLIALILSQLSPYSWQLKAHGTLHMKKSHIL
jgi:hypothetical protein